MPTILKRMFQPKWQSSNPQTRIDALRSFQWEQSEQRAILLKLAETDPDPAVRQAAIARIPDADTLMRLLDKAAPDTQPPLCNQLASLFEKNTDLEQLKRNFTQLPNDQMRSQLFRHLNTPDRKLAVLETLNDANALADIALTGETSRLRQQAAEQLQDYRLLEDVMKASKNKDKGVYQAAKAKLNQHREQERRQQQLYQQAEESCSALEAHAASESLHLYQAKYEALVNQWQTVASIADADLAGRAERAIKACAERVMRLQDEEQARSQAAQRAEELQKERQATCEALEQALTSLTTADALSKPSVSALDALIKTQENRWLEATRDVSVDKAEQKRYQQAMHQIRSYFSALQKYGSREARITELASQCQTASESEAPSPELVRELRQLVTEIEWPEDFSAPATLVSAQACIGQIQTLRKQQAEDVQKLRKEITRTIDDLERKLEERALRESSHLYKELQKLIHQLPSQAEQDYQGKLKLLHGRLQDLRDWQGFATQPKQIDLCERMEHLAEQHLDPQLKATRIKELQNEWRALGGSSDQALWSRFKTASDKAFEPCQEFFAEQDRLKQANLEKRQVICDQLQTFLDQVNWDNVDWKAMDRISRKAREEWHHLYPVDHKQNKPLQKQFHRLIETLEGHLNEERNRNAALKADIVSRAEALASQDDVRAAAQSAKALQKEWQTIGVTEHREDRRLWKAFRAACDQIFERLGHQRADYQKEVQERIERAELLCTEAEQLRQESGEHQEARLNELQQEFRSLGQIPRDAHQKLQDRFQQAVQAVRQTLRQQQQEQLLQQWRELARQAEELARFEDSVISGQSSEPAPELSLPAGIPTAISQPLKRRQQTAASVTSADYQSNERSARLLAIQAEIAAGVESPDTERALRMEYQMERLSEGLAHHQGRPPREEILEILATWYGLGPVEPSLRVSLQQRLDQVLAAVL